MKTKEPQTKRTIDSKWFKILQDLDVKMIANRKQPFLTNNRNQPLTEEDINSRGNDSIEWYELTAIASTKDRDALEDLCSISYEEDEDCDSDQIELDLRRSDKNKIWEFEVNPLGRSHPQVALENGFITGKTYEEVKAELIALPDGNPGGE